MRSEPGRLLARVPERNKYSTFRHSCRNRLLKLSMNPLSAGRLDRMKHNCIVIGHHPRFQSTTASSVLLSTVMLAGNLSLSTLARSSTCATCLPVIAQSASRQTCTTTTGLALRKANYLIG